MYVHTYIMIVVWWNVLSQHWSAKTPMTDLGDNLKVLNTGIKITIGHWSFSGYSRPSLIRIVCGPILVQISEIMHFQIMHNINEYHYYPRSDYQCFGLTRFGLVRVYCNSPMHACGHYVRMSSQNYGTHILCT